MNAFRIPWGSWYGNRGLELSFPESWSVDVVAPKDAGDISDEEIRKALDSLVGSSDWLGSTLPLHQINLHQQTAAP